MPKISQVSQDSSPVTADYVVGNQASGPTTQRFKFSDLIALFWNLVNIPAGATSPITRDGESQFAFVASGLVWSGDSYGSTRNASMTAGIVYINGRRISISAVTARTFLASSDTYVDVLDNGDGTGTLVFTTVSNNLASPSLAANSIRIAIVITGTTSIAAAGSVNQGQITSILPIASSTPYTVTDSLGNLICNHDPASKILGFRLLQSVFGTSSTTQVQITSLSVPFIMPSSALNRKVKTRLVTPAVQATIAAKAMNLNLWDGTVGSGTNIGGTTFTFPYATQNYGLISEAITQPVAGASKVYNAGLNSDPAAGVTTTIESVATYLIIELD